MAKKDQDKHFEDQFDDEEVLFVFRKHPIVMRRGLIIGAVGPLLGTLPTIIKPTLGLGWFFAGVGIGFVLWVIILFPYWINWFYSVFIVTDQRLIQITQKGLFNRTVVDLTLGQIQMVNYQVAGLQETMLGFGTIMMQTYVGDLVIHDVHHPARIAKKIMKILRDKRIVTGPMSDLSVNKVDNEETEEDK